MKKRFDVWYGQGKRSFRTIFALVLYLVADAFYDKGSAFPLKRFLNGGVP